MTDAVVAGLPGWVLLAPLGVIWLAALVDVVTDRSLPADAKLLWLVFMFLAVPLAPVRFLLRRTVVEPAAAEVHPARDEYIAAVESADVPRVAPPG